MRIARLDILDDTLDPDSASSAPVEKPVENQGWRLTVANRTDEIQRVASGTKMVGLADPDVNHPQLGAAPRYGER